MKKKDGIEITTSDLIDKQILIKDYQKYTDDKALLIFVLDKTAKESFAEDEVMELIKNEMERVIE